MKLASTLTVLSLAAIAAGPLAGSALGGENAARAEAAAQGALGDAAAAPPAPAAIAPPASFELTSEAPMADDVAGVVDDDDPLALEQGADNPELLQSLDEGLDAQQVGDDYLKTTTSSLSPSEPPPLPSALTVEPKLPLRSLAAKGGGQGAKAPGPKVADLQKALNANGAKLAVDGKMGKATKVALSSFQKQHGLSPTGEAGPETLNALGISDR